MRTPTTVEINIGEVFEHLLHAPIVEAVIDIRARATQKMEESAARSHLEGRLDSYHFLDSRRAFHGEVALERGKPPRHAVRDLGWHGVRFRSSDGRHIAQFNLDGFVFSRLEPYEKWERLFDEALRLWTVFKEMAQPAEIQRIGLRFINRIPLPPGELRFEDYIQPAPTPPLDLNLPFHAFMHHDTLAVPGHPYAINVIRTIQAPQTSDASGIALILDIDVFTKREFELTDELLSRRLREMRWLKNKAFFGSITKKAVEMFR